MSMRRSAYGLMVNLVAMLMDYPIKDKKKNGEGGKFNKIIVKEANLMAILMGYP